MQEKNSMHRIASSIGTPHSRPIFMRTALLHAVALGTVALFFAGSAMLIAQNHDDTQPFLPSPMMNVSTVPANGDVNPYGVAFVPQGLNVGLLHSGDILVSNFNDKANLQGTGTTIVSISPTGKQTLFFQGKVGIGLSTSLHVLKSGIVLVGNFPSTDGTCATATAGSILIISPWGQLLASVANQYIDGPWDSAVIDNGSRITLFVANGLSGTISRLVFARGPHGSFMKSATVIGSGFGHQCDPVTFVDAPTGLVYNPKTGSLYVASTVDNKVFSLHDAATINRDEGTGRVLYADNVHLHGPLAMTWAPNGHLLVSNNDAINSDPTQPSEIVEFTRQGKFVKQLSVDPAQGGSFGLNVQTLHNVATFAAVDDNTSSLLIWTLPRN